MLDIFIAESAAVPADGETDVVPTGLVAAAFPP